MNIMVVFFFYFKVEIINTNELLLMEMNIFDWLFKQLKNDALINQNYPLRD